MDGILARGEEDVTGLRGPVSCNSVGNPAVAWRERRRR